MEFQYLVLLLLSLSGIVIADVYMHNPRGSNNRLNEKSANRNNGNRLFDSQNNNRGGYNVGDLNQNGAGNNENNQYRMSYFQSSSSAETLLPMEWTNQHGCGGNEDGDPHKQNCNIVLQYMCQDDVNSATGNVGQEIFRNGVNTGTQTYQEPQLDANQAQYNARLNGGVATNKGLHEPWKWYDSCYLRERNKGLFTADQQLKSKNKAGFSSAIYTRQNPNGNRRGYECPEERDYYPYWHPTPWKDIAVLTDNTTLCKKYQQQSFNVQPYHQCVEYFGNNKKHYSRWNNEAECVQNNGQWIAFSNYLEKAPQYRSKTACEGATNANIEYKWAIPYDSADGRSEECLVALKTPQCQQAPWSRSNHLGNTRGGQPIGYNWTLPYFPSEKTQRCVVRIRYNISTDDYDPFLTNASSNQNVAENVVSPIQQNPYVSVTLDASPLRLAINTAQLGRTFQDRSHVIKLKARPSGTESNKIYNLNVRGKRGNIVQVYPAVEYDFIPNYLNIGKNDLVHIQWTGSNTHNNGNPAGDGQAGDAGEGKAGSDRSNFAQSLSATDNYPVPYENSTLWANTEVVWIYHGKMGLSKEDLALSLASSGYYQCRESSMCRGESAETKGALNNLLNNAPASYQGALIKITKEGEYHYLCTRNNNFSNRSQKGTIIVK